MLTPTGPVPGISVAQKRVRATDKEPTLTHGYHRHVAVLCVDDGRRIPAPIAIRNIRRGIEAYSVDVDGLTTAVEVIDRCPRCDREFLRTARGATSENRLLYLPDCR
jgi:hypothetical protein